MTTAQLQAHWERKLKAEGLAPLDKFTYRGAIVVRAQIIEPHKRSVSVEEPARLAQALEAWLGGDASHFTDAGRTLLTHKATQHSTRWPKRRAKILVRICWALADGQSVNQAASRRGDEDLAYRYLRRLYALLAETPASIEDADDAE